jgi:hypothetical protein
MESPLLDPPSRTELVLQWQKANAAAVLAENDWNVLCIAHAKNGGPSPPESLRENAESLRRAADALRRQLWAW